MSKINHSLHNSVTVSRGIQGDIISSERSSAYEKAPQEVLYRNQILITLCCLEYLSLLGHFEVLVIFSVQKFRIYSMHLSTEFRRL